MFTKRLFCSCLAVFAVLGSVVAGCLSAVSFLFQASTIQNVEAELEQNKQTQTAHVKPTNSGVKIASVAAGFVSMLKTLHSRGMNAYA